MAGGDIEFEELGNGQGVAGFQRAEDGQLDGPLCYVVSWWDEAFEGAPLIVLELDGWGYVPELRPGVEDIGLDGGGAVEGPLGGIAFEIDPEDEEVCGDGKSGALRVSLAP